MKTSELIGAALDWAVAKIEGREFEAAESFLEYYDEGGLFYSIDWAQGGPIIEREGLSITYMGDDWLDAWKARKGDGHWKGEYKHGPTPLIAAMRCYVASRLGDEVNIPDELEA